jgi:hypothetical protein
MSETAVRNIAQTEPGQSIPAVAENEAVSFLAPFEMVRHLLANCPAPRRPNRNRPIQQVDPALQEEFGAWEAASDETLEKFENSMPE